MDISVTGHIADIPEEQFDRLDPAVGVVACYAKVKQREADGRWRVTYVHGTDDGQTKAAIPLYASYSADWSDPAYDPRAWALPPAIREDCTAARCMVVESYEDRCSGLHVDCSAREPLAGRAWWCPRELAGRTPHTEERPTRREVPG